MTIGEDRYLCRTELADKANETFRALGIRPPLLIARLENKSKPSKVPLLVKEPSLHFRQGFLLGIKCYY